MNTTHSVPRRRRLGYLLSALAVMFMMAGASAPSPFYGQLQISLGMPAVGITVAFAIYAVALLAALLTVGSLSDHIGRRPVVSVGFLVLAGAVVLLLTAPSPAMLFVARAAQGLASGALMSPLSAMIADFAPPTNPRAAAIVTTVSPMVGLAAGAVFAGAELSVSSVPMVVVFLTLAVAYALLAVMVWVLPETSGLHDGWRNALIPRVAVPAAVRMRFAVSVPVIIAGWATGGLFLSLGATIISREMHVEGPALQGLIIGLLPMAGVITVVLFRRSRPRSSTIYGAIALGIGTALTLLGLVTGSVAMYLVGVAIAGSGFGTAFSGAIGSLIPAAEVDERAELFSSIYVVAYLAFGVPSVVAGVLLAWLNLYATTILYGVFVIFCVVLTLVSMMLARRRAALSIFGDAAQVSPARPKTYRDKVS